jgi:UDP-N-acetylmuramoyl-tripeptide--D-alanyl-D-alanine ligase
MSIVASAWSTVGELAALAGGALQGAVRDPGAPVEGVSIDTRTLAPGDLFVPLAGGRTDGHDFLAVAFARGAAAALCARDRAAALRGREPGPLVVVDDVTAALQRAATEHRRRWSGLLIGVTGSAGKTTTKDLVARALATSKPTLETEGNLNNHWGVPLTLLRLRREHEAAVVEMGMNHPGEIEALAAMAAPAAAVITNVGRAHLEAFGTVEAIAHEKTALARALPAGAPVFAGADSPVLMQALTGAPQRVIGYGVSAAALVRPERVDDLGADGVRVTVAGFPPCRLALVGRHQALNALAAFAVAREYALAPAAVVRALEGYRPLEGRMEVRHARGAVLLGDFYNANPDAMRLALETLAGWMPATRRIAVLGDMLELGLDAPRLHAETAEAVRDAELWVVGRHANDYAEGARRRGIPVRVFDDKPALARALAEALAPGVVVLLKGSRGAAIEQVLDGLEQER